MKKILVWALCFLLAGNAVSFAANRPSRPSSAVKVNNNSNNSGDNNRTLQNSAPSRPSSAPQASKPAVVGAQSSAPQAPSSKPSRAVQRQPAQQTANVKRERPSKSSRPAQSSVARPSSNVNTRIAHQTVKVTKKPARGGFTRPSSASSVEVTVNSRHRPNSRPSYNSRHSTANTIASLLFFPFAFAFHGNRHHSTIYVSRPYYDYPYYYYPSRLYYSPYWWHSSPDINYNTYNNYTYVQSGNSVDLQKAESSDFSNEEILENIKLQGARYIDNPKSVALTILNETQYKIAGIVIMFVFRGSDFTEIIENINYNFNIPLAEYEKKFMRIDLSGIEFQTPQSFSVVAVVQALTTADGEIIAGGAQTSSYEQEN